MDGSLSEGELVALWQVAWEMARRLCAGTLARLARGEGGFYEAEDFYQDLFIEFWRLARVWRRHDGSAEALWRAWRRRLWGGGRRILRRAPQRLWHNPEYPINPLEMALAGPGDGEREPSIANIPALEALTQPEDAETAQARSADLQALEEALWALRPAQRQILYMAAVLETSPSEVAQMLHLGNAKEVYQHLYRARRALRRHLSKEAP